MTNANALLRPSIWQGRIFTGDWIASHGGVHTFTEPATGEQLGRIGLADADDVARSATLARAAQAAWAASDYKERAAIFRRAAAVIAEHHDELATWIVRETGAIRPKADLELREASAHLQEAASMLTQPKGQLLASASGQMSIARRMPHGVVGVISPFNFPLILSIRSIAPALATGNAVVHKPDLQTPVSGGVLIARIFEEAGLPKGVLHVLPGAAEAGQAMCGHPDIAMIAFTGSTAVGRSIGELAGRNLKKMSLELGGKNSLIILDDADPDIAAANVAWGAYLHQGQICMASGRVLLQRGIAAAVIERLVAKAGQLPVGDPMSGTVALGPLISARQVQRVHSIVQDSVAAGATLLAGGTYENQFYQPTVLTGVRPGMRCFEEELFGPVASVTVFDTDQEAIALASATTGCLALGVITPTLARAMFIVDRVPAGHAHINDQTVLAEAHAPFGGGGTSGNGGRHGGSADWDEFTQWQWLTVKTEAPRYPF
ncbi:aldehyde dehydrogenase family protein [Duganella sp. BJB488]|uniref:benzaldehyde dehydrogenase n=1 Tax=unclassified Duganella TaxID=2636909 RepID=UPI000E349245|nr:MULTISPECIES: benzaldehyde dehydrogenase [unclassified Duganella]RFP17795.1 aldehyde dehydrogenase family protein [Duganella sp. BJB489]RFP22303.1 aldehyde dehydrogenase family protein [Duganella sp. BJB488]RFP37636.1 aldehyde dehydrogenase family protein [Duganella sp. BJB480]